jgi:hypothetical protein
VNIPKGNRRDRRSFIGGSDARIVMGNEEAALLRLWREKRGELEPEDLSENLPVQLLSSSRWLNAFGLSNVRPAEKVARGQSNHIAALEANGRRDEAKERSGDHVAVTRRAQAAGEGQGGGQRNQDKHVEVKPNKPADQAGDAQQNHVRPDLPAPGKHDRCNAVQPSLV